MPINVANLIKLMQQYLAQLLVIEIKQIVGATYFSPFLRSPAPFLRIRQCLEQMTKTAPDTAYPAVDRVLAQTRASC
jgi:hypothetical protein